MEFTGKSRINFRSKGESVWEFETLKSAFRTLVQKETAKLEMEGTLTRHKALGVKVRDETAKGKSTEIPEKEAIKNHGEYLYLGDEERKERENKCDQRDRNEPRMILSPKFKRREKVEKVICQLLLKG